MKLDITKNLMEQISSFKQSKPNHGILVLFVSDLVYNELKNIGILYGISFQSSEVNTFYGSKIIKTDLLSNLEIKIVDWDKI